MVEFEAALDDHVAGLRSECYPAQDTRRVVNRELDRLGLDGWSVVVERGQADGNDTCTYFLLDAADKTVALIPIDGLVVPDGTTADRFADELGTAFTDDCMTLHRAVIRVRELAADQGHRRRRARHQRDHRRRSPLRPRLGRRAE